jgi:type IV pilus assembly protein PilA
MKTGFTLIEIMIVVAIIALLAAIAIPNLLRARINANEANAQATLKTISAACEAYASTNNGNYPGGYSALLSANPAYVNDNYTNRTLNGYNFTCGFSNGYACNATPETINKTGVNCFNITTGSVLKIISCIGGGLPCCVWPQIHGCNISCTIYP